MGSSAGKDVGQLFQQHGALVYRRAFRLLGRRQDAEEATQEVFVRVMRGLDGFENRSSVTTWLYQITTHYCLDLLRNGARRRQLLAQQLVAEDRQEPASASDIVLLRQLLSECDEQQGRAVVYVYLDGMSHEQAAEVLGVSKRTVGNLIERFFAWAQKRSANLEKTALPRPGRPPVKPE